MKNIKKSKAITPITQNKIKRMSRKATQTITAIQTSNTMTQASDKLGIGRSALYERIKRYDLTGILNDIKKQAEADLIISSPDIVDDLIKVAMGEKKANKTELTAKQDVLDRAGITKKEGTTRNTLIKDMSITFEQL